MKKKFLFLMALLAVSLLALAEMTVYVYQKDGTKDEYLAANVDSIGFVNVFTITFDANGGDGSMDVVKIKEGETITLPDNTFAKGSSTFAGWNTQADGSGTAYADQSTITPIANVNLYAQWQVPEHEYVDLGLPSGTLWATMNVGATSPEDYGDYFAWGETSPKEEYNWSTYKWCNGSGTKQTKYCTSSSYGTVDNKTVLHLADDAANANWGGAWRMPTKLEQDELRNFSYTTWTWTTLNGVRGYKVKSKINGNSIFLPAAGSRSNSDSNSSTGSYGFYWSRSLHTIGSNRAYYLYFLSGDVSSDDDLRSEGQSVRPVMKK
jgi:hypothetical protein